MSDKGEIIDEHVTMKFRLSDLDIDDDNVARYRMTPEQARKTASGLLAAAAGLPRLEDVEVRGKG
jgi:hypothetical protein